MRQRHYYIVRIEYLGFRYHGWAKQPAVKTIQGMVEKTLRFVLEDEIQFKTLGSGRTDGMVSATGAEFELFIDCEQDVSWLKNELNKNLPQDIRIAQIVPTNADFNIIQSAKNKEYLYLFSYGEKNHPFAAPYITNFQMELDISLMKQGAKLFEGKHNFIQYCYKPKTETIGERNVLFSKIVRNTLYVANFFPENTFLFRVQGKGFMRHQIRLMVGALMLLGKGDIVLKDIEESLTGKQLFEQYIAPASGLILNSVTFEGD